MAGHSEENMNHYWLGAVLATAISVTGCGAMGGFDQVKEDFHYSYPLESGGHLRLGNSNGSVQITGWDRNTIDISGTKYAPSAEELRDITIKASVHGSEASIQTEMPRRSFHGSYGVAYVIHVPRKTILDRLETSNGSVSLSDLEGGGRIVSSNGRIAVNHALGDYQVRTTNGSINLDDCRGAFRAESSNGALKGNLAAGSISASTTNGSVNFTIDNPKNGEPIRASSTNGSVMLAMAAFHDNTIKTDTTNGSITLRLPRDTNANVNASTSMASIKSDLPILTSGETSKHHLTGKLGNGGPLISAETTMGSIRLQRY
jgi:hypothetical protein